MKWKCINCHYGREIFPKEHLSHHDPNIYVLFGGYLCGICNRLMMPLLTQDTINQKVAELIIKAEENYGKTLFYAEDRKDDTSLGTQLKGEAAGWVNKQSMNFTLSPHISPSIAIRSFFYGNTICECHSLVMAVLYWAILELVGDQLFDLCFSGRYEDEYGEFKIENAAFFGASKNIIKQLMHTDKISGEATINLGDWVYVRNHFKYKQKHPEGAAGGWNLICSNTTPPRKRYVGFGLSVPVETPQPVRSMRRTSSNPSFEKFDRLMKKQEPPAVSLSHAAEKSLEEINAILMAYYNLPAQKQEFDTRSSLHLTEDLLTRSGNTQPVLEEKRSRLDAEKIKAFLRFALGALYV